MEINAARWRKIHMNGATQTMPRNIYRSPKHMTWVYPCRTPYLVTLESDIWIAQIHLPMVLNSIYFNKIQIFCVSTWRFIYSCNFRIVKHCNCWVVCVIIPLHKWFMNYDYNFVHISLIHILIVKSASCKLVSSSFWLKSSTYFFKTWFMFVLGPWHQCR